MIPHNIGKAMAVAAVASLAVVALFITARTAKADAATQPSTQPTGSITVLIVDSDKNPVPGATIRLSAAHGAGHSVKGTADDKGSFTFTDIPAGRYNVRASMKDVGQGRGRVELNPGAEGSASVTVTITLTPRTPSAAPATQPT